jgi:hypothetical protein
MKAKIKTGLKRTLMVILLFITFVIIINTSAFDEELRPEVIEIMKTSEYPTVEGNAYFALMGLKAAADKSITQTGHELVQRYIDNLKNGIDTITNSDFDEILAIKPEDHKLYSNDMSHTCFSNPEFDCLTLDHDGFYNNFYQGDLNQPRLKQQLSRYQDIVQMKSYQNFNEGGFGMPLPEYSGFMKLNQIHLINQYKNFPKLQFLKELNASIKFSKLLLTEGEYLIDKMVALSGIRKNIMFLSEYLRNNEVDDEGLKVIEQILTLLTPEELNLSKSFESEANLMFKQSVLIEKDMSIFNHVFYQPNATKNDYFENNITEHLAWAQLSLKDFIKARSLKSTRKPSLLSKLRPHFLYNFIGKVLNESAASFNIDDYVARGFDLNNMIILVQLQLQIKLSEYQEIDNILSQPENANPYNDKPFDYDGEKGILKFECLDDFQKCEIKI